MASENCSTLTNPVPNIYIDVPWVVKVFKEQTDFDYFAH
jgi:hypothetical protein